MFIQLLSSQRINSQGKSSPLNVLSCCRDDVASSSTFTLEDSAICLTSEQSTVDVDIDRDDGSILDVYLVRCIFDHFGLTLKSIFLIIFFTTLSSEFMLISVTKIWMLKKINKSRWQQSELLQRSDGVTFRQPYFEIEQFLRLFQFLHPF